MPKKPNSNNNRLVKKILIMGLDNSGKTSLVLSLKGRTNLLSFYKLDPTKGIKIENFQIFDSEFTIWDFGGQKSYREEHLRNFSKHLARAEKIIYVIDVQATDRYSLALEYLKNIFKILMNDNYKLNVSVFLHKFDPDLEETHPEITEERISEISQEIKAIIPEGFQYNIFKTTIYTIFEKTILY